MSAALAVLRTVACVAVLPGAMALVARIDRGGPDPGPHLGLGDTDDYPDRTPADWHTNGRTR